MFPELLGGFANATIVTTLGYPPDILKVKMQSGQYSNYIHCIKDIYHNQGMCGFYKGCSMPWISHCLKRPMQYALAEQCKDKQVFGNGRYSNYITGLFQGSIGTILGNPLQVIKIRSQTNNFSTLENIKFIWNSKNIIGFYRGFVPTLIKDGIFGMSFLGNYYTLRDEFGSATFQQNFINGALSHCITWMIFIPIDTVKTNVQKSTDKPMINVIKSIYNNYGIIGFWRGIIPACVRTVPLSGCAMMSYEGVRNMIKEK